jgi:hypothetical protein
MDGTPEHAYFLSMVINDFDIAGSWLSVRPRKANAPLLVYADRILPNPVAPQRLKLVAWQTTQVDNGGRGIQNGEPACRLPRKALKGSNEFPLSKLLRQSVFIAQDHADFQSASSDDVRQASKHAASPTTTFWLSVQFLPSLLPHCSGA